jgi:very-short-patch-repair endonuclease
MAAVLAAGAGAWLSHRAAAALWSVLRSERLEVSLGHPRRSLPGIAVYQSTLAADELTTAHGIPVTTVPRTLIDLAAVLPKDQVERAVHEAEFQRLPDSLSLVDLVARYPGRRGIATIRAILASLDSGLKLTRSELESRFLALAEAAGLPCPEVNARLFIGGRWLECDCVWRPQRLVVELDGRAAHATAVAFERDRGRDRALHAQGWRVVRITWRQLHNESRSIAADLTRMLD